MRGFQVLLGAAERPLPEYFEVLSRNRLENQE